MGPTCKHCRRRCAVLRVIPTGLYAGQRLLLATCTRGMADDREDTGGYDYRTANDPLKPTVSAPRVPYQGATRCP